MEIEGRRVELDAARGEIVADLEPSSQLVEDHCGSEMTDVWRSLNGRTAQIDADATRSQGRERAQR